MPDTIRITIEVTKEELAQIDQYLRRRIAAVITGLDEISIADRILNRIWKVRPKENDNARC